MDHDLASALAAVAPSVVVPGSVDDLPRMRASMAARGASDRDIEACGYERKADVIAVRGDGGVVRALHLHPRGKGRVPVLVYLHGGGGVAGTARTGLISVLKWAARLEAAVLSVDYRLAPEHPSPAAAMDCAAVLTHVGAGDLADTFDARRSCLVGVSGGGYVAAGTLALLTTEPGYSSADLPAATLLLFPMLDHTCGGASAADRGHGLWNRDASLVAWRCLLGPTPSTVEDGTGDGVAGRGRAARRPLSLDAEGLARWPPTLIETGALDPLRSDGSTFAELLGAAGADVTHRSWRGAYHCVDQVADEARLTEVVRATRAAWIAHAWISGRLPAPEEEGEELVDANP